MMTETLVPALVEADVVAEMSARLPALGFSGAIATTISDPRPTEFIRTYSVGGVPDDIAADAATLVVEAYANKRARAERICANAVAALQAAARDGFMNGTPCRRVDIWSLPASLPDPDVTDRIRYSSTVSVVLRRTAV